MTFVPVKPFTPGEAFAPAIALTAAAQGVPGPAILLTCRRNRPASSRANQPVVIADVRDDEIDLWGAKSADDPQMTVWLKCKLLGQLLSPNNRVCLSVSMIFVRHSRLMRAYNL